MVNTSPSTFYPVAYPLVPLRIAMLFSLRDATRHLFSFVHAGMSEQLTKTPAVC